MTTKSSRQRERAASRQKVIIGDIPFSATEPTRVSLERLHTWVTWQFPRQRSVPLPSKEVRGDGSNPAAFTGPAFTGHSGAAHPGLEDTGWYPAIIDVESGHALIFAHIPEPFPTPEAAAKHLDQLPD